MNLLVALIIGIVALLLYFARNKYTCKSPSLYAGFRTYLPMVKIHAAKNGLDWRLVAAHITAESGWNASLVSNKNAIGLAQVLCTPDGNGGCANKLPAIAIWPTITQQKLFDPDTNVETACQIMAWNQENYGLWRGIAVYENWSAHKGVIHDVVYMERVLCSLHKLQQEYPPNE